MLKNITTALKSEPVLLTILAINSLFLIGGGWLLRDIAETMRERETRNSSLLMDCIRERK